MGFLLYRNICVALTIVHPNKLLYFVKSLSSETVDLIGLTISQQKVFVNFYAPNFVCYYFF